MGAGDQHCYGGQPSPHPVSGVIYQGSSTNGSDLGRSPIMPVLKKLLTDG
ncbi:MAG TPA: hypothetical protein VN888_02190 [Mycobacterium sp.]|nr:hypothetical protein [Mycobacterium sp.]